MKPLHRHQIAGFSLVELMVALTIGTIILAAVSLILVNSKKNYTTQDSLARLQENGRFAMQFLARDLRMAGYYGCSDDLSSVTNTVLGAAGSGDFYDTTVPIQGSDSKSNWQPSPATPVGAPPTMKPGTDAIAIRYLDSSSAVQIDAPYMNNSSAALHTSGGGLKVGDIVMLMDCSGAATFQITGPGATGDAITGTIVHNIAEGSPGNSTKDLGKIYEGSAKIGKFYSAQYYISVKPDNNQPALYRATPTGTQELVEGIEDLQILYGVDSTNADKIPDIYKKATAMSAADWSRVVTIRFGILARTLANTNNTDKQFGIDPDTATYDVDSDNVDNFTAPGDFYQRRIFRATVALRNMQ